MNHGWIVTPAPSTPPAPPWNPAAQTGFMDGDLMAPVVPDLSVGAEDADAADAALRERGAKAVRPFTDVGWGVRRFFVQDPYGRVVHLLGRR